MKIVWLNTMIIFRMYPKCTGSFISGLDTYSSSREIFFRNIGCIVFEHRFF